MDYVLKYIEKQPSNCGVTLKDFLCIGATVMAYTQSHADSKHIYLDSVHLVQAYELIFFFFLLGLDSGGFMLFWLECLCRRLDNHVLP